MLSTGQVLLLCSCILSTAISVCAAIIAVRAGGRLSRQSSKLSALSVECSDLRASFDSLLASQKRLVSRVGMQRLREARAGVDEAPPESAPAPVRKAYWRQKLGLIGPNAARNAQRQITNSDARSDDTD